MKIEWHSDLHAVLKKRSSVPMAEDFPEGHFGDLNEDAFSEAALQKKQEDGDEVLQSPAKRGKTSETPPTDEVVAGKKPATREVVAPHLHTSANAVSTRAGGDKSEPPQEVDEPFDEDDLSETGDEELGDYPGEDVYDDEDRPPCFGAGIGEESLTLLPEGSPTAGRNWWARSGGGLP